MGEGGAQEGRRPARVSPHNYGARCYVGRQPTKDKWSFDISSNPLSHSPTKPLLFVPHPKCYLLCLGQDRYAHRPPGNVLASGPQTWCPSPYFASLTVFLPSKPMILWHGMCLLSFGLGQVQRPSGLLYNRHLILLCNTHEGVFQTRYCYQR